MKVDAVGNIEEVGVHGAIDRSNVYIDVRRRGIETLNKVHQVLVWLVRTEAKLQNCVLPVVREIGG